MNVLSWKLQSFSGFTHVIWYNNTYSAHVDNREPWLLKSLYTLLWYLLFVFYPPTWIRWQYPHTIQVFKTQENMVYLCENGLRSIRLVSFVFSFGLFPISTILSSDAVKEKTRNCHLSLFIDDTNENRFLFIVWKVLFIGESKRVSVRGRF